MDTALQIPNMSHSRICLSSLADWQIADAKMLDEVQRKALSLCLDSYATSGRVALEVELGVKPLEGKN